MFLWYFWPLLCLHFLLLQPGDSYSQPLPFFFFQCRSLNASSIPSALSVIHRQIALKSIYSSLGLLDFCIHMSQLENVPQSQHIQNWNYFSLPKFKLWIILGNLSLLCTFRPDQFLCPMNSTLYTYTVTSSFINLFCRLLQWLPQFPLDGHTPGRQKQNEVKRHKLK